jgi:hypothetical protein
MNLSEIVSVGIDLEGNSFEISSYTVLLDALIAQRDRLSGTVGFDPNKDFWTLMTLHLLIDQVKEQLVGV